MTINKDKWIRVARWIAVLPAHLATPFIMNFFFDLGWRYLPAMGRFGIEADETPSFLGVIWIDIVVRITSFWVAVAIAPSHKKAVFFTLLSGWIAFAVLFCGFEITHGQSWFVVVPFFLQVVALLVLMRFIDFQND